jgi:ech hydrogenase subunit E
MSATTYQLPLGPERLGLEEPMYFNVEMDGEVVAGLDVRPGKVHRGIEYLTHKRNFIQNITLTERVCSLCSNSHPATFCMALEQIAGLQIPERAEYLRVIAEEVKRVASNLFNVGLLAHLVGLDALFRNVMETREIMQDAQETVFGNRMGLAANCIGGVRYDVDAEQREYLGVQISRMMPLVTEIRKVYESDPTLLARTWGIGVLSQADAGELGLVGPVARGSGIHNDVRKKAPYAAYDKLKFEAVIAKDGDVWSRAMVRIREAEVALDLIQQCLRDMPEGPVAITPLPVIPAGEAIAKTEAPRGELIYYLRTDGSDRPERLKWRVPSFMNWSALPLMVRGHKVEDIAVIVNSIDPCVSCTER